MKKLFNLVIAMTMMFSMLTTNTLAVSVQVENTSKTDKTTTIETEILIGVTADYDGTLNDDLKELGVVSVEKIFDVEDTLIYFVKTQEVQSDIIKKLEALNYVKYAEFNQVGDFLATTNEPASLTAQVGVENLTKSNDLTTIETEILIGVTADYDGTLNDDLKELGVVSVEKIFDGEDTLIYFVKTEEVQSDIIKKLEALNYVKYAEFNQEGNFLATTNEPASLTAQVGVENLTKSNDLTKIETEILIGVTADYDGTLNNDLKELGVVSVEKIFDVEDTLIYLVKTQEVQSDIIKKLEALNYVKYAEFNQEGNLIESTNEPVDLSVKEGTGNSSTDDKFTTIKTEILIGVTADYDGTLNNDLKELGIVSIEKLSDIDDAVIYCAKTEEVKSNIISDLETLSYVKYAEFNQTGNLIATSNTQENNTMSSLHTAVGIGCVVVIGSLIFLFIKSKKKSVA